MSKANNNNKMSSNSEVEKVDHVRPGDNVGARAIAGGASTPKITGTYNDVKDKIPKKVNVNKVGSVTSKKQVRKKINFNNLKWKRKEREIVNKREKGKKGKRGGSQSKTLNCVRMDNFKRKTRRHHNDAKSNYKIKRERREGGGSLSKTLNCVQTVNNKSFNTIYICNSIRDNKVPHKKYNIVSQTSNTHGCMKVREIRVYKKDPKKKNTLKHERQKLDSKTIKSTEITLFLLQDDIQREDRESIETPAKDSEKQKGNLIILDEQVTKNLKRFIEREKFKILKRFCIRVSNTHGCMKTKMQTSRLKKDTKKDNKKDKNKIIISLIMKTIISANYLYMIYVNLQDSLEKVISEERKLEESGDIDDDLLDGEYEDDDPNATVAMNHEELEDLLAKEDLTEKEELDLIPGQEGNPMQFRSQHLAKIKDMKERRKARVNSTSERSRSDSVSSIVSVKRKLDVSNDNTDNRIEKDMRLQDMIEDKNKDDGKVQAQKRSTFVERLKGNMNVEIRTDPAGIELEKEDFEYVAIKMMGELVKVKKTEPEKAEWKVVRGGASQGAIYYVVETQKTIDFIKLAAPRILPLPKGNEPAPTYKYVVFGPNEHPYVYLRWRIQSFWKPTPVEELTEILLACNEEVNVEVPIPGGGKRDAVIKVKKVLEDKPKPGQESGKSKAKKSSSSTILYLLEVEPCLVDIIINKKQGLLSIGPFQCRVEGGAGNGGPGIQERVKIAAEAAKATGAQPPAAEEMETGSGAAARE